MARNRHVDETMPLLAVENLSTHYFTARGPVKAVDGVNFSVERGQSLGIAGESGCGKTTVALSLMRLVKGGRIVSGNITLDDMSLLGMSKRELNRIRWDRISLVPQAAMSGLNPVHRVGAQIVEAIVHHRKVERAAAWDRAGELLRRVQIDPARLDSYPHELSGGMRQRAMIAMALALDPDLVIADEPTTALDTVTQARILGLLKRLKEQQGVSIILISHDLSILGQTCDRVMIMYAGQVVEMAEVRELYRAPEHPYTRALLRSFPDIRQVKQDLAGLSGSPPDLSNPPTGCRFYGRCPRREEGCAGDEPPLVEVRPRHYVRCPLWDRAV
ncbi:MAG: ABC transporter ATP-binding protein [Acidobacteriota bacterium]